MTAITLLGAGGHARVLIALLDECGYEISQIVDINSHETPHETINDIPVVAKDFERETLNQIVLSVGDNEIREKMFSRESNILRLNLIDPSALIKNSVKMGDANQVFANVFVNEKVMIGDNNIINSGAIIEHECTIGSHIHISVGAVIAGRVSIGNRSFIGANSTIIDNVNICSDVIIGAGSVVISDITQPGTYVGNPVRKIK